MTTDRGVDLYIALAPILDRLCEKLKNDKEYAKMFSSGGTTADLLFKVVPFILKDYGDEAYEAVAVLGGKTVEEVHEQPFGETYKEVVALFKDPDLRDFFSLFFSPTATEGQGG